MILHHDFAAVNSMLYQDIAFAFAVEANANICHLAFTDIVKEVFNYFLYVFFKVLVMGTQVISGMLYIVYL